MTSSSSTFLRLLPALALLAVTAAGQQPAPGGESERALHVWLARGSAMLRAEDPLGALLAFRAAPEVGIDRSLGLGRAHLMLGNADFALAYGEVAIGAAPRRQDAMALAVRALIRSREFDDAVLRSQVFLRRVREPGAELWSARGSALFRVQRTGEAAQSYRRVLELDRFDAEANLRLGSGLLDPVAVEIPRELRLAVAALQGGLRDRAIELFLRVLEAQPGHPIAHRLLGEALFAARVADSMAMQDESFRRLEDAMPRVDVRDLPIDRFVPGYRRLSQQRRRVVDRTAALFRSQLRKLIQVGGRHDLLNELERTTDSPARATLRGRRTFDGRVWDDVRGVGGLRAATGIEALDEAQTFGFDTFAHEVAHQVHFFTFTPLQRARIRALYRTAMKERRCLDYYAASNEAEYFGQGVEAFVSLAKRPGGETTHGHTRFELARVDPELHRFIAEVVDFDPLADAAVRDGVLAAAVAVAIRCGRPDDAIVAAEMMTSGLARQRLLRDARRARAVQKCH